MLLRPVCAALRRAGHIPAPRIGSLTTAAAAAPPPPAAVQRFDGDPFALVGPEVHAIMDGVKAEVVSEEPILETAAEYYFQQRGKLLRPVLVVLMARAANRHVTGVGAQAGGLVEARPRQQQLAAITEMIHVASLLHDDVLDGADTRRRISSLNTRMGNKTAVLAGDFLLARASVWLSRLRDHEVTAAMSTSIAELVEGEFKQALSAPEVASTWDNYLKRSYLKTGALIAHSCRAAAILSDPKDPAIAAAAYNFGRSLGVGFQIIDDFLDYTGTEEQLGKPPRQDLAQGLITAPLIFALEADPALRPLVDRKLKDEGDFDRALAAVESSGALDRTKDLAQQHCRAAVDAIAHWADGPDRAALAAIADFVQKRLH